MVLSFIAPVIAATAQLGLFLGKIGLASLAYKGFFTEAEVVGFAGGAAGVGMKVAQVASKAGAVGTIAGLTTFGGGYLIDKVTDQDSVANRYGKTALNGAAIGATLGSVIPGLGTAIGAGIGAIGGAMWAGANDLQKRSLTEKTTRFFESKGWTHNQAIGLAANIERESSFNADASGDDGEAYGLGQWHKDRQIQFEKVFGHSIQKSTFDEQLGFYDWELRNTNRGAGDQLRKAQTAADAAGIVSALFERPADKIGEAAKRAAIASQMAGAIDANPTATGLMQSPAAPAWSLFSSSGSDANKADASPSGPMPQSTPAPILNVVNVTTKVDPQGRATTKVETSSGVKIGYTSPVLAGF